LLLQVVAVLPLALAAVAVLVATELVLAHLVVAQQLRQA
jgi:hypothetical protein